MSGGGRRASAPRRPPRAPLLDGDLALHAGLAVAGDRAEERVGAGLERHVDGGDAAVRDHLAVRVHAGAGDGDVVGGARRVLGVEGQRAGRGGGVRDVGELAVRVGVDLELAVLGATGLVDAAPATTVASGPVSLPGLRGDLGDVGGDVVRVVAGRRASPASRAGSAFWFG